MKKILVLAPVLPQQSDIEPIVRSLAFLQQDYHLDFIDPLASVDEFFTNVGKDFEKQESHSSILVNLDGVDNTIYYQHWRQQLKNCMDDYDAFLGFSFGGVILQQCFSLFEQVNKSIILFSTPTYADIALKNKLGEVIQLCKKNCVDSALNKLYADVFYPNTPPTNEIIIDNYQMTARRLILGLQRVLETNSTTIVKTSTVEHLHLIGENSHLVNHANVIAPQTGELIQVPHASMRVLQDNLTYCQPIILERLRREF